MAHFSEKKISLTVECKSILDIDYLPSLVIGFNDVCVIRLPAISSPFDFDKPIQDIDTAITQASLNLGKDAVLIVIGEIADLVKVEAAIPVEVRYQHWIAIKKSAPIKTDNQHLLNEHFGLLIHTKYKQSLKHTKTRVRYTYCPSCDKTTKDYGGKKHTYHESGTLLSDVWRDISCHLSSDISPVLSRLADLFGMEPYEKLMVLDCSKLNIRRSAIQSIERINEDTQPPDWQPSRIIQGDCIREIKRLPNNSVDFVFADPPYNLHKQYSGYSDDMEIRRYFEWCDEWISEAARVLKPGRTLALLNIPLWSVRHFQFLATVLNFQNWITWDALSFPVRFIMPAHYTILCFSKGEPRELPGLIGESGLTKPLTTPRVFDSLNPLADGYCLRADCIEKRFRQKTNNRGVLTDVWGDIHRLKHNSRRVDHPCQLPPQLMYRLISVFTKQNEMVLDPFNGAGTTTLSAHQIKRRYIGIESSPEYCEVTKRRHQEILSGIDPFRREERTLTAKNSPVARLPKQKYMVSKKTLQLDVKRIAQQLGRIPTRNEVLGLSKYPIDYFDTYFVSWGEVTAAARTTGMTDKRVGNNGNHIEYEEAKSVQLRLFEKPKVA